MVRQKKNAKVLELPGAAAHFDPASARYAFVYAVALHDTGRIKDSINVLEDSIRNHPFDRDTHGALVEWCNEAGYQRKALAYTQRLNQPDAEVDR